MYEVLEIKAAVMTRNLILRNMETTTVEKCFDYSDMTDSKNFDFLEVGKQYHCKIALFGSIATEGSEFRYMRDTAVGLKEMSEVKSDQGDIYYIGTDDVTGLTIKDSAIRIGDAFMFDAWRKDLIQVDDIVHGDLLRDQRTK